MKKVMLVVMGLMMFAPAMAAEMDRKAQCEAWAAEDKLDEKAAKDFIAYCMEEVKGSLAPEGSSAN